MPDREKLIKAWEIFRDSNPYQICEGKEFRAFKEPEYCMGQMIADTIDLLKEQDNCENCAIAIEDRQPVVRCKDCVNCIREPNGDLYCDILAIGYEPLGSKRVTADWYCADGERRC